MAKGKPTLRRRPRRVVGVVGPPTDRALLLKLVVEMNHIAQDVSLKLGVSPEEQRQASRLARRTKARLRPSAALMATITGTADVLSTWRRDKRYRGTDGSPRVLPIRGKGATLQTLARKCVPQMSLKEVLDYICSHGEATLYKGDRVALLGKTAVIARRTPEMTLAWMLTQFRHIADTTVHNAAIPAQVKGGGLYQRQVSGWLTDKKFRHYARAVRPLLQALSDQLEAGLSIDRREKPRANRKECGVGLFVYQDSGSIG
jgi:hypothetical protein